MAAIQSDVRGKESELLSSENKAFAGKKPVELIESTEGLVRVVTYPDACRAVF